MKIRLCDFFLFQLVDATFFRVIQMSGTINVVITNNFALKANSQHSEELKESEANQRDKDSPETNNGSTEELINDDFTFSGIIVEDTVESIEESSTEETDEAGGTESGEEISGIIDLSTVHNVGSDDISSSTNHTNDERFPSVDIGVDTSGNADHTSNGGSGNGSSIFSDGSSSGEKINKDDGDETSTRSSEDSTSSGNFSINIKEGVLQTDSVTSIEEDETAEGDDGTKAEEAEIGDTKMLKFIFVLSLSRDQDVFSSESLSSGDISGVAVSTNGGSSFLDISVERNRGKVSLTANGGRSDFRDSNGASGEDSGVSAISVVSGLNEEATDQTSKGTSTENDERTSIIEVANIVNKETQTEGPSIDERKDDHVEEEVEDANSLNGDSFTHHSSGNGGGN